MHLKCASLSCKRLRAWFLVMYCTALPACPCRPRAQSRPFDGTTSVCHEGSPFSIASPWGASVSSANQGVIQVSQLTGANKLSAAGGRASLYMRACNHSLSLVITAPLQSAHPSVMLRRAALRKGKACLDVLRQSFLQNEAAATESRTFSTALRAQGQASWGVAFHPAFSGRPTHANS